MDTLYRLKLLYLKELYKNLVLVPYRAQCLSTGETNRLSCVGRLGWFLLDPYETRKHIFWEAIFILKHMVSRVTCRIKS